MTRQEDDYKKKKKSIIQSDKVQSYLRYSGMAFELLGLIIFAVIIGQLLDRWLETNRPYFTAAMVIFFFSGYIIRLFYQTGEREE